MVEQAGHCSIAFVLLVNKLGVLLTVSFFKQLRSLRCFVSLALHLRVCQGVDCGVKMV